MSSSKPFEYFSENQLYNALLQRESGAYDYIYLKVKGSFKQWIFKHNGSTMDAEDAFQKGLLNFLLNLENGKYQLQENAKITTVIFDYCKKKWLKELNSSRIKTKAEMPLIYNPQDDFDFQSEMEFMELMNVVRNAMNLLKDDCRNVIEWFYILELPLKEIAEKLNLEATSTKQKRFDCMKKLRSILKKQIQIN